MNEPTDTDPDTPPRRPAKPSVPALLSLISGTASLPATFCCMVILPLGLLLSATGVTLGIVALVQIKNAPPGELRGREFAIAGIVTSALSLILFGGLIALGLLGKAAETQGF